MLQHPSRTQSPIQSFGVGLSLAFGLGCANLLGIEDAVCDPAYASECGRSLDATSQGGSAGTTATLTDAPAMQAPGIAGSGTLPPLDPPPTQASLCDHYCQILEANCVGAERQYASPEACQAVCEHLEPGEPGAVTGNTVECRIQRAELAGRTGEPANYCASAGPGGAGHCGEDCEGFCSVMSAECLEMGNWRECLDACASVPNLSGPPDNLGYDASIQSGDSLQCRLFHVSAASLDPVTHCSHAAGLAICRAPL
jgi:hypothetical protein